MKRKTIEEWRSLILKGVGEKPGYGADAIAKHIGTTVSTFRKYADPMVKDCKDLSRYIKVTIKNRKIRQLEAFKKDGKRILLLQRVWGGWVVNRYDYICVSYVHWDED